MDTVHYVDFNLLQPIFTTNRLDDTMVCEVMKAGLR